MNVTLQSGTVPQVGRHVAVVTIDAQSKAPSKRHTILLLDCSGSMAGSIKDVGRDSIRFIKELGVQDYVSVIIYSGYRTAKLIAGPTPCTKDGRVLLGQAINAEVRVMNTTVFSEPLDKALATAKMLAQPDIGHNAVLFTDGCPVPTHWSNLEEWQRVNHVAKDLHKAKVIVSVIGYTVHYDEKFIHMIMSASGNTGTFRHISEIEDFCDTVEDIRAAFTKTTLTDAQVSLTPPLKSGCRILRVLRATPNVVGYGAGEISLNSFYEDKATFFVELSNSLNRLEVTITEGKHREELLLKADPLSSESADQYIRILGAHAFLTGNRTEAAELLRLTGDEHLADRAETSYTTREQRETGDRMRRVFRNREFIGAGLKPAGPSHCVLNVIRALIEDPECVVYIPKNVYKRSGILTRDPRVIENPHSRTLRVVGYVSNESRFNFSLRTLKDVKVRPEGGGIPIDAHIYRTYNVILDGNLHLSELQATLSEETFELLKEAEVIPTDKLYDASHAYTLNLRNLRLISTNWANPGTLGLVPLLREEADLEVLQTVLNTQLRQLDYEQRELRDNIYHPKENPVEGVVCEYYTAPCVEIRLMRYKAALAADVSNFTAQQTETQVRKIRRRLGVVRFLTRAITFAMETVGSTSIKWESPKETHLGAYTKTERLATFDGARLKRVDWIEQAVCS